MEPLVSSFCDIRFDAIYGRVERTRNPRPVTGEAAALCVALHSMLLRSCLDEPQPFHNTIDLPDMESIELDWMPVGLTAGVGLWQHGERVEAASILLSGLERAEEVLGIERVLESRHLALPAPVWPKIAQEEFPLVMTVSFTRRGRRARALPISARALAHAFFAQFGVAEW